MAPKLGASLYCSGREGRQSNWLGSPNKVFIFRLCLHQPFRLGGTTHNFPGFGNIFRLILGNELHIHISYSGAYGNRHPFLIICGGQN